MNPTLSSHSEQRSMLFRLLAAGVVAMSTSACGVSYQARIADDACEHCYVTASGVPYKSQEAYDP